MFKKKLILFIPILLLLLSSCGARPGMYSVVVMTRDAEFKTNNLNDLGYPYKKKKMIVPTVISKMSEITKAKLEQEIQSFPVHNVDTTVAIKAQNAYGIVTVIASKCNEGALGIVMHDSSYMTKRGKFLDIKLRYVCMSDDVEFPKAATKFYKISDPECEDGFHQVEFMFPSRLVMKETERKSLLRALSVCSKNP